MVNRIAAWEAKDGTVHKTREEADRLIREGIAIHIAGLREDGQPIPEPVTTAERISIAA